MKRIMIVCGLAALSACASMSRPTPVQEFEAYRAELKSEREKGEVTAVQEQEQLRDRYWKLFGRDAESAGHFAFCTALMRSAQAGDFPMNEAEALVDAREKELMAERKSPPRKRYMWNGDPLQNVDQYER